MNRPGRCSTRRRWRGARPCSTAYPATDPNRVGESDPQLRARAVPAGEGPPVRVRDGQRDGGARRRPRRPHRGVPAVQAPHRRRNGVIASDDPALERDQGLWIRTSIAVRCQRGPFRRTQGRVRLPRRGVGSGKSTLLRLMNRQEKPRERHASAWREEYHRSAGLEGPAGTCAATSATSSRTTSCSRTRRSSRTWRSPSR